MMYLYGGAVILVLFLVSRIVRWWNLPKVVEARTRRIEIRQKERTKRREARNKRREERARIRRERRKARKRK